VICVAAAGGGRRARHHPRVLPQQGNRQYRRNDLDAVVSGMDLIWLIPLLPGLGAASMGCSGCALQQACCRRVACTTMAGTLLVSVYAVFALLGCRPTNANTPSGSPPGSRVCPPARGWIDRGPVGALGLPPGSAVRDDDSHRQWHRVPDPRLLDGYMHEEREARMRGSSRTSTSSASSCWCWCLATISW